MRIVVAFSLSFVLATIVGTMMLPDARHPARSPLHSKPVSQPVAPSFDFLPALPSFIVPPLDDLPKQYNEAWQLLKSGQYRAAERSYLQILIRNPEDQKAMQGLVTLQRYLANHDREKLNGQAQRFRLAAADGRLGAEEYARRELELLAKASESASKEIATERALKVTALRRISPSDLAVPAATPSADRRPLGNAIAAVKNRISKLVSSVRLLQGPPSPGAGPRPKVLPSLADTRRRHRVLTAPGGSWSRAASPQPGATIGNLGYSVSQQVQEFTTPSPPSGTGKGDVLEPARTVTSDPGSPSGKSNGAGSTRNGPAGKASGSQREGADKDSSGSGGNAGTGDSGSGKGGGGGGNTGGGGSQGGKDAKDKDSTGKDAGDKDGKEGGKGGGGGKGGKGD